MTAKAQTKSDLDLISPTRRRVMGIVFLAFAVMIWVFFSRNIAPGTMTTFDLNPGGSALQMGNLVLPSVATLNALAAICAMAGSYQLVRAHGFGKRTNMILGLVAGMFVFGFLVWAAAGKSLNIAGLLKSTLFKAVPLTLGAMSGILCERAGIVNIAIEGMMLMGAMLSTLVASITGNLFLGVMSAVLSGALLGLFLGVLSIKYMTNQIVSGTVINIFSAGITSFISAKFMQTYQDLNNAAIYQPFEIPLLARIPIIGPIFFNNNIFVYALFVLMITLHIALFYSRWGLRMRSVGEHPKAADTLGINVYRTRYIAVTLGGMMAGFAGSYFTLGSVGRFDELMTAGRGFIGLAAMIFGNWNPFGAFGAGLLFGFADSLQSKIAILGIPIPSEFLLMAPYIATMIVLAGVVGRSHPPASEGVPYTKE